MMNDQGLLFLIVTSKRNLRYKEMYKVELSSSSSPHSPMKESTAPQRKQGPVKQGASAPPVVSRDAPRVAASAPPVGSAMSSVPALVVSSNRDIAPPSAGTHPARAGPAGCQWQPG